MGKAKQVITAILWALGSIASALLILALAKKLADFSYEPPGRRDLGNIVNSCHDVGHTDNSRNCTLMTVIAKDFIRFFNNSKSSIFTGRSTVVPPSGNPTEKRVFYNSTSSFGCWIVFSNPLDSFQSDDRIRLQYFNVAMPNGEEPDFTRALMGSPIMKFMGTSPFLNATAPLNSPISNVPMELGIFNVTKTVIYSHKFNVTKTVIYTHKLNAQHLDWGLDYEEHRLFYRSLAAQDNRVGIDTSEANFSVNNAPQDLSGNITSWYVWIDSNSTENTVSVFLSNVSPNPVGQILHLGHIKLLKYLPENVQVRLSLLINHSYKTNTIFSWKLAGQTAWNRTSIHVSIRVILIVSVISVVLWVLAIAAVSVVVFRVLRRIIKSLSTAIKTLSVVVLPVLRRNIKNLSTAIKTLSVVVFKTILRPVEPGDIELLVNKLASSCKHPREYKYNELAAATNNFSEDQKLGQGGFGSVYKGNLQDISETVAVKRISEVSSQGAKEYMSEITVLDQVRHRSLVPLLGWCHEKASELLLVYRFMPNGSLDKYLFGPGADRPTLQWNMRYRIACDIASALLYLHDECEQRVLHRDIKPSNIMLDFQFQAKLGDFGLARVIDCCGSSHFTALAGTHGYLAPETAMSGTASTKSDVFSFGVVALEIACGRRALDRMGQLDLSSCSPLVEWVWDLYGKGCILDAADNILDGEFDVKEMRQLMVVGLWCSNPDHKKRPKIRQVLQTLKFEAPLPTLPSKIPSIFEFTSEEFTSEPYCQLSFPNSAPALPTVNRNANNQCGDSSAPAITM